MVPELKTYVDLMRSTDLQHFLMVTEEWERSQPEKRHIFKQSSRFGNTSSFRQGQNSSYQSGSKKPLTCYFCGKIGHISKECRSQLGGDSQKQTPAVTTPVTTPQVDRKPIVCFSCYHVEHKSPPIP